MQGAAKVRLYLVTTARSTAGLLTGTMATFKSVPQCDFAHLLRSLHRVFVDGRAYTAATRQESAYAYTQRYKMVTTIVHSEWTERITSSATPDVVFGATWSVPAYFVYSHKLDLLWVYGYSDIVAKHAVDRATGDKVDALQRARKLLMTRELESFQLD